MTHSFEKQRKNSLHYNVENLERFNDLCSLILKNSPISFVAYFRVFEDGRYLSLANDMRWQEHFANNIHYNGNNFKDAMKNTPTTGSYKFLWPQQRLDEVFTALRSYDICNGINLFKRGDGWIESWAFASQPEHDQVNQLYVNNVQVLEAFSEFAMRQDQDLFDSSDPSRLGTFKASVNLYGAGNPADSSIQKIPLLNGGVMNPQGIYMPLTKREVDCLKLFAQGKTAKKVGETLGIKQRTVESYFVNIKAKTGYRRKVDVLDNFFSG